MKKLIKYFLCAFILFLPLTVHGTSADIEVVTYDIKADVKANRTVNIDETYNFYFINQISTFTRIIDTKLVTIRPNMTKRITNVKISNVNVKNNDFEEKIVDNKKLVKILLDSKKDEVSEYNVSYTYNLGKDTGVGFDELFLNLIDGTFNANISNINFEVTLPFEFDAKKVQFLLNGKYNLTENDITYSVKGNTIYGVLERSLSPLQTFSIRVELKDRYFINTTDNYNYMILFILVFPLGGIIYGIICWVKFAKGNKIKGKMTDVPPYDFDPAEISYLYKGFSKESDIVTLLITLANRGYLMFEESDDGYKLDKPNSFKIIKLKDYDDNNAAQKILFEKLFENEDTITLKDIEYNLFDSLMEAKNSLDNEYNRYRIFYKNMKKIKTYMSILGVLSIITVNSYFIYLFANTFYLIPIIIVILCFGIYILIASDTKLLIKLIFGIAPLVAGVYVSVLPIINESKTMMIYIVGMILIIIQALFFKKLPERTIYGNNMLGDVYGFKSGLKALNKEKLTQKLIDDPNYFYNMYPYVYLFDICEDWNKKGNEIITSFPSWYVTKEEFSLQNFQKFVRNMVYLTTQAMFKKQFSGMSTTHVEYKKDLKVKNIEEK
ncbi:MAG: DUF2207 domain-containing protein [Bacilli bacterium]|nr:DUF2207 domain-containing protein [Bacilli bacterium]